MCIKKIISFFIASVFIVSINFSSYSQGMSPYSTFGLGDLQPDGFVRNQALAGTGVSMPNSMYINNINPALTSYNNSLTIFEFGADWQRRNIAYDNGSVNTNGANVAYISLSLPISSKWVISIGAKPYSKVNNIILTDRNISNQFDTINYSSFINTQGGLNKFYLTNGFKITQSLRFGATIGIIVGSTNQKKIISGLTKQRISILEKQTTHRLIDFNFGISYRKKINETYTLNTGATFGFGNSLSYEEADNFNYSGVFIDTLETFKGKKTNIPTTFKIGASLEKNTNWNTSIELSTTNWSQFKWSNPNEKFQNTYKLAASTEYIHNPNAMKGYFNRVTIRAGLYHATLPMVIRGTSINEQGISLGMALPMKKSIATINWAVTLGQRGTTENGLAKEKFIKITLGATVSDRWFVRPKID